MPGPPHLLTLADLSVAQIKGILDHAFHLKHKTLPWLRPRQQGFNAGYPGKAKSLQMPPQSLFLKSVALIFSKRSTRTRVAGETSISLLGGKSLFLGREDIQLGVNESLRDTARIVGGMCEGIVARVGDHSEIEELAKYSPVPVINALSSLWHPTQVLADLLTLYEHAHFFPNQKAASKESTPPTGDETSGKSDKKRKKKGLPELSPLTVAYVGDSANVFHDILVTFPRFGHQLRVATPPDEKYRCPKPVWDAVQKLGIEKNIWWGDDPKEAVKDADVVITDTWISMGQEAEYAERVKAFQGYQVTEQMCREGGAKEHWKFMHCLPRKEHEVDDEVFYGPRSLVFPEADNRKWTSMAVYDLLIGKWTLDAPGSPR